MIDIEKEYKLLEELSFVRVSGTENEDKAAKYILNQLDEAELDAYLEPFTVDSFNVEESTLEVLEPVKKSYPVMTYANSGCTDENGLVGELYIYEGNNEVDKKNAKGKIVLVNGFLKRDVYKELCKAGAIGFIAFNGDIDMPYDKTDIDTKELREPFREYGVMPGVQMKVHDVMDLINSEAKTVKITVNQPVAKATSANVICDVRGTEDTKETIIVTAHYDSVPYSKGAYDNATGSAALYALAMYFDKNQPKRNIRFIFCGSEERGLLGSKSYCRRYKSSLENVVLNVNIDMIGSTLGKAISVATADNELVTYTDYFAKIQGYPLEASQGVYSSDSTPFADNGVPAVSFARITPKGGGAIHNRCDVMEHLNKNNLKKDTEFIAQYIETLANSYAFPVKKEMPDNMKEELDKYLGREKEDK